METQHMVLLGGGGHCHSVIESIERTGIYKIAGILEPGMPVGQMISSYPVIGNDSLIPELVKERLHFLVTVGHIKNAAPRQKLFELLKSSEAIIATITDPAALVSSRAIIGRGTVVLRNAFINSGAVVGDNCIINTGALVEHDAKIGNHVHISTGAIVNGDCIVGDNCFIGSGAVLSNNISICDDVMIGACSFVFRSISEPGVYHGNPARLIK